MSGDNKQLQLVKTEWGFYQYKPMPSEEELREHYADEYYQEGQGSYEVCYSDEEIEYFRLKAWMIYHKTSELIGREYGKAIDIGCGEGWVLDEFYKNKWNVFGVDFSKYAIEKFNPHLLPFFEQGNFYELLKQKINNGEKFDAIILANVIEHVVDPVGLLKDIQKIMHDGSLVIMVAPNDFSRLHIHLLEKEFIKEEFWTKYPGHLKYPRHLSFFNKDSMHDLLTDLKFKLDAVVADNPIDLNLLNDNSNYIKDPSKGRNTHYFRVRTDNFLASIDRDKLLQLREVLGSMGVGRDLTYYCSLS